MLNREKVILPTATGLLHKTLENFCNDQNMIPITQIIKLIDLNRLTFEKSLLKNSLRHTEVVLRKQDGELSIPKPCLYVHPLDVVEFLFKCCSAIYEEITPEWVDYYPDGPYKDMAHRIYTGIKQPVIMIKKKEYNGSNSDNVELLSQSLSENRWKSRSQLEKFLERSRTSALLLGLVVDQITFRLPGSSRTLRRYILKYDTPKHYSELQRQTYLHPILPYPSSK